MNSNKLYKYRDISLFTEKIFTDGEIYFRNPNDFNDPFECQLPVAFSFDEQSRKKYIRNNILESLRDPSRFEFVKDLFHSVLHINPSLKESEQRLLDETVNYVYKLQSNSDHENNLKNVFFENTGIYCLSKKNDSILMWSHYANNHTGICIEFDEEKLLEMGEIYDVNYVEDFNPQSNVLDHIVMKSKEWSYESEKRLVKFDWIKETQSKNFGKFTLPLNSITGLIFGCKIDTEVFKKYCQLVLAKNSNIKIYKTERVQGKFKLDIIDYSDKLNSL
jgi:hypothetical protein